MKASLIIPSYRRFSPLINTLKDLQKQDYEDFEIVVVDQNLSWPEDYREALAEIWQDLRIVWLTLDKPEVVTARNFAVQKSCGEILIFVDDDVEIPDPLFIAKHVANYLDPSVHVVIGRECMKDENSEEVIESQLSPAYLNHLKKLSPLQQALWFDRNSDYRTDACFFSTCNGSIRKDTFLAVKGFDENFQGNSYGDDSDLILRIHQVGFRTIYDPTAWLIHLKVPMGGLRMGDVKNKVNYARTATGLWLFLFRHGTRDMYWHLILNHVLKKTIFLKINITRPWRQIFVIPGVLYAFFRALRLLLKEPKSRFDISQ